MGYYNNRYNNNPPAEKAQATDIPVLFDRLEKINCVSENDRNIIESMKSFFTSRSYITERQYEFLKKLNDKYNDEKLEAVAEWRESFTQAMRDKLNIVCEYYSGTGYFSNIVRLWEMDKENYIPTPEKYEKITENAYAKKLIESRSAENEFNLGDLVCLRSTARTSSIYHTFRNSYISVNDYLNKPLFVVDNNVVRKSELHRYCRVFSISNPDIQFDVREKDLKKFKTK